jgi:hypothetical protein
MCCRRRFTGIGTKPARRLSGKTCAGPIYGIPALRSLAATGASLAELMARLGHSTPQAAMRYQHAAQGRDREIAALLSKIAQNGRGVTMRPYLFLCCGTAVGRLYDNDGLTLGRD